jgi:phage baseplate assembly protein V
MGLFDNEEALGRLNDLIKIGEVSSIDPERCTARVVFDDDDSIVSYDLPILQRNTLNTKDFHSVNVGEDVLCLFLPSGPEEGFILGSFYAGEIIPPEKTEKHRTTVFEDGTVVQYAMESHTLTVLIEGTSIVFDRQNGVVTVPQGWTVNCENSIVNAGTSATINTKNATVNASGSTKIDSPTTTITGDVTIQKTLKVIGSITGTGGLTISGGSGGAAATVTGTLKTTGDVVAGGISLQSHTHTEQGDGAETSAAH